MRYRRSGASIAVTCLLFVLTGCLGIDPGQRKAAQTSPSTSASGSIPTTTSAPPPLVPTPHVGVCRRLTFPQIGRFSNTSPRVPCASPHTAYTYAVRRLARSLDGKLDSAPVQRAAQRACRRSFATYLGGDSIDRATTRLTPTYFLPRAGAFANGTRWVRCDVVALLKPRRLAALPSTVHRFLDNDSLARGYALCSQGPPGSAKSILVMCTQPHTYRAVTAISLGKSGDPPPTAAQLVQPKATCRVLIAKLLGVDGGFSFVFTYPNDRQWVNGQRYGLCWNGQST